MNTDKKLLRTLTKGDILLAAVLILVSLVWFASSFASDEESLTLKIYLDGTESVSVSLASLSEEKHYTVGGCIICADSEGVCFEKSDCLDGLCIKRGRMTRAGDAMACVPERVVVRLYGSDDFDTLAY